ncbi:MAG: hypothetical protein ABSC42_09465 [Tepidisphaeraceae bacterium]
MRMAFGLVGLLGTIAVIVWIMHAIYLPDVTASLHAQQKAETFVNQLNGVDANGVRIEDTYAEIPDTRADGKLQDLQITLVRPGSPMEIKFGLRANDVVIAAIDGHTVRTDLNGLDNEQAGKDAIRDAYTTDGQLVVQRGDNQITLPLPKSQANPNPPAPNTTAQNQQMQQNAQRTEQQQEHGKSGNGEENGTMDEIHQRLRALPTY